MKESKSSTNLIPVQVVENEKNNKNKRKAKEKKKKQTEIEIETEEEKKTLGICKTDPRYQYKTERGMATSMQRSDLGHWMQPTHLCESHCGTDSHIGTCTDAWRPHSARNRPSEMTIVFLKLKLPYR
jgi:hypothetical protein